MHPNAYLHLVTPFICFTRFFKEAFCSLVTGLCSMPLGCLQFIPLYHIFHDVYHIHTEVCCFLTVLVYGLIIWIGDRHPAREARTMPNKGREH